MRKLTTQTRTLTLALLLAAAGPLWAHGDKHDHSPKHGGVVVEAGDMDWELVAKPERVVIHVRDHGKPGKTAGGSGKLVILSGKDKAEAVLKPAGDDRLEAEGPFTLGPGSKLVATVTLAGKKPANVRFTLK